MQRNLREIFIKNKVNFYQKNKKKRKLVGMLMMLIFVFEYENNMQNY